MQSVCPVEETVGSFLPQRAATSCFDFSRAIKTTGATRKFQGKLKSEKNQYFSKNKEKKFEFMYICIINYGNFFEVKKVFEKLIVYLKYRFQQVF